MSASRIRRLPDHLVNKIAAGEVVERPASVVKELVENALDALCTQVTVDLRDAGRALIRVTDDGVGMSSDEVDLALLRHATSKLATDADLDAIATLGLPRRGAARHLRGHPLLGALVPARRRRPAPWCAARAAPSPRSSLVAAPAGTTVEAQDLFFNTPARLKFLKSAPSEVAAALRLLEAIALAHPDVHFRVSHNGRPVLGGAARRAACATASGALWGFERAGSCSRWSARTARLAVSGLVAPPQLARGNRDEIVLIVNGRPVRDTPLTQTLIEAYRPAPGPRPVPGRGAAPRAAAAGSGRQRPPDQGLGPLPLPAPGPGDAVSRGQGRAPQAQVVQPQRGLAGAIAPAG